MTPSENGKEIGSGSGGLLLGFFGSVLNHAENVALLHDEKLFAIDFDFSAGPFAEQHTVTWLHVQRNEFIVIAARTGSDGHDLTLLRLFLRRIRDDDSARRLLFFVDAAHYYSIMQRPKAHWKPPMTCLRDWEEAKPAPPAPEIFRLVSTVK